VVFGRVVAPPEDLALQATVLAHGIAEGQQFIDGNKRMALIAMLAFLEVNGCRVEASDPELADWILSFSRGANRRRSLSSRRPIVEVAYGRPQEDRNLRSGSH
jgi:prophage maintenance system killer protein